jgi:hypothetical protein
VLADDGSIGGSFSFARLDLVERLTAVRRLMGYAALSVFPTTTALAATAVMSTTALATASMMLAAAAAPDG